ncbi:MAG: ComEA family DNA-binding protein [Ruthenibacterium sp.]
MRQFVKKHLYGVVFCTLFLLIFAAALLELPPLYLQRGTAMTKSETISALPAEDKIDVNTAVSAELEVLDGIGQAKAKAIILYREQNGPFQSVEELTRVHGISEGILAKIKNKVTVS